MFRSAEFTYWLPVTVIQLMPYEARSTVRGISSYATPNLGDRWSGCDSFEVLPGYSDVPFNATRPRMPLVIHSGVGVVAGSAPACCSTWFQLQPGLGVHGHL